MTYARPLAALTALAAATLLLGGCAPQANDPCNSHGEFYTHVENGKRTTLRCEYVPDTSGRGRPDQLKWVKA